MFTWGKGKYAGAGAIGEQDVWEPTDEVYKSFPAELQGESIVSLAAGQGHTLVAMESGEVLAFGTNNFGQCGSSKYDRIYKVSSLVHEHIVSVAAGGNQSFAITDTGKVYTFGLVHVTSKCIETEDADPASSDEGLARMVGLANDEEVLVEVDNAARGESGTATPSAARELSSIVRDSATRWMIADAEEDYHRELREMGYNKEDAEERIQEKGREYHGMINIGCRRQPTHLPLRICSPFINNLCISSVAVGHAHFMLLSECGRLFAGGYNDRGQLGLGHRIGTAQVQPVLGLDDMFVVQVACGQQHTVCRVSRTRPPSQVAISSSVFVWGNGTLGQLGLGRLGTSKGRLIPTPLTLLGEEVTDISCGENFTVAVCGLRDIYSWGHSAYQQHADSRGGSDFCDPYHYFVPRQLDYSTITLRMNEFIEKVSCGSNFTVAKTNFGNCFTWGWMDYGVLGRGKGFMSSSPSLLHSFGDSYYGEGERFVKFVATGSNHCVSTVKQDRNFWATTIFRELLTEDKLRDTADVEFRIDGYSDVVLAHSSILAARSNYFCGMLQNAQMEHKTGSRIVLDLSFIDNMTPAGLRHILTYIYCDVVSVRMTQRTKMAELATSVCLEDLKELCLRSAVHRPPSTFEKDILRALSGDMYFPDVCFYYTDEGVESNRRCLLKAHKFLLAHLMPYFHSLFFGNFAEAQEVDGNMTWISIEPFYDDGIDSELFLKLIFFAYSGSLSTSIECEEQSGLRILEEFTRMLVASNRFGFTKLAQVCENKILDTMKKSLDYVEEIKDFASSYNFISLEKKCDDLLRVESLLQPQPLKMSEMKSTSKSVSCASENMPIRSL